ncbi:hypothetical protein Lste_0841 [Legionella steelei]|uniref:Uncharacterized protein n=1 Tax=Legionella steelei TaxID=947033 RepID=A0A0W0ZG47_9GAMM|nr:hypothetical protein [Legionella steelei]KTD67683.1 hypothetical protein Lste_0841 [Legionella steelei]
MQSKDDSSKPTESSKKIKSILSKSTESTKKTKKSVSWNDTQSEGQIRPESLKIAPSASPTKKVLEQQIKELQRNGYSEIEATAIVGVPSTPSGQDIIHTDIYYTSRDKIAERRFFREQNKASARGGLVPAQDDVPTSPKDEDEVSPYSFFSPTTIGMAALAVAALGFAVLKK